MSQFYAAKLRSLSTHLVAGTPTTVYTCPDNFTAKLVLLLIANTTSGNKTVSVQWYDKTVDDTFYIVGGYPISAYSFLKFDQSYMIMNPGDYMTITSEAGSTMDALVSVEEYADPNRRIIGD